MGYDRTEGHRFTRAGKHTKRKEPEATLKDYIRAASIVVSMAVYCSAVIWGAAWGCKKVLQYFQLV